MRLAEESLTNEVRRHFKVEIERKIFDAAVQGFDSEDNPLRLNNFAFAMRELGRIWLEHLAPKEQIRQCEWFVQNTELREKDGVTRAQRAKFAVQGPLHDDFVRDKLDIDVDTTVKEYTSLIDRLSNFGHDIEKSFDLPPAEAEQEAMDALETFDRLATLISERHESLLSEAADEAKEVLTDELFSQVQSELDILSTHSTVEGVHLESLTIISLDSKRILFESDGSVDVRLQYGSDADVARNDGAVSYDSYPLDCKFEADTERPLEISIVSGSLRIDTDSFYDDGED
ncbi:MAG: hypothetical protein ABSA54_17960 [Terriglobales bacterium]|jgi:hypothetical protein